MSSVISNKPSASLPSLPKPAGSVHAASASAASRVASQPVDTIEKDGTETASMQEMSARPMTAQSNASKASSQSLSNKAPPTLEHSEAVAAAKTKGLSALMREVSAKTSGARAATKYTTIAGIGLAFGLLFAGQPFAVMLIAPAFAAIGTVIAFVMRSYQNNKRDASIDAFKELMQESAPYMQEHPDFAEAQMLNAFLTDQFSTFAKTEFMGLAGGIKSSFATLSAKFAAAKEAQMQKAQGANEAESDVGEDDIKPSESISNAGGASTPKGVQEQSIAAEQEPVDVLHDAASNADTEYKTALQGSEKTTVA